MYDQKIHALVSDLDMEKWLIDNLKDRKILQKFLYLWNSADKYYDAYFNWQIDPSSINHFDFIGKYMDKSKKLAIISLGCGNSSQEKQMLIDLKNQWYNFTYFWVDISRKMLTLALENLADLDIEKRFIMADIMSEHFRQEISTITKNYDVRFYCFLGRTFCNTNQTNSTDSFYNLLDNNDFLWFDVYTRENDDEITKSRILDRYNRYIIDHDNEKKINFQFSVLESLWVNNLDWKFVLDMKSEKSIWSLVFSFYYFFTKKSIISFRNETVHILPWEKIELYEIRNYYKPQFLDFFEQHNFKNVDYKSEPYLWDWLFHSQFLFKKNIIL